MPWLREIVARQVVMRGGKRHCGQNEDRERLVRHGWLSLRTAESIFLTAGRV